MKKKKSSPPPSIISVPIWGGSPKSSESCGMNTVRFRRRNCLKNLPKSFYYRNLTILLSFRTAMDFENTTPPRPTRPQRPWAPLRGLRGSLPAVVDAVTNNRRESQPEGYALSCNRRQSQPEGYAVPCVRRNLALDFVCTEEERRMSNAIAFHISQLSVMSEP